MHTKIHWFFLLLIAPLLGFLFAFQEENPFILDNATTALAFPSDPLTEQMDYVYEQIKGSQELITKIQTGAELEKKEMEEQQQQLDQLLAASQSQVKRSEDVLDQILSSMLGKPIGQTFGKRATIKVFSLEESGYKGFMAKVKLHDPHALKMVLAKDSLTSKGETTSQAAKRKQAVLAVNAGGFMKNAQGASVPLGITVVDGQIKTFSTSNTLSFVGFNQQGRLVGGKIQSREQLEKMGILQGASFLPTLLEGGRKVPIPKDWANKKHPRTLIGHFSNGDLLMIVIDGRRKGWSEGVTLEEAQQKLLEFKVRDAYNLDGGGSSAFYYDGKIRNRPSDGKERPVSTNIVILP
ncbi:phosphodiester glycosidase family protein [Ammoniphilus sp. CFH 90114]|uniref:phosphodiester glycosidase family protein n=1 Tax=Ammoniphilus sp. CFH 90114 TaxID=2493665 RepID=UPI00100DFF99|nr:phosphodiester glycosidase family protein [Ammoniphilus sp. CFH 90114]RXT02867.1 phosphodiester glycosidase family protein [Ammoniphilus sp. CFH 90114]